MSDDRWEFPGKAPKNSLMEKVGKCARTISTSGHGVQVVIGEGDHDSYSANFRGDPAAIHDLFGTDITGDGLYEDPPPKVNKELDALRRNTQILINGQPPRRFTFS